MKVFFVKSCSFKTQRAEKAVQFFLLLTLLFLHEIYIQFGNLKLGQKLSNLRDLRSFYDIPTVMEKSWL